MASVVTTDRERVYTRIVLVALGVGVFVVPLTLFSAWGMAFVGEYSRAALASGKAVLYMGLLAMALCVRRVAPGRWVVSLLGLASLSVVTAVLCWWYDAIFIPAVLGLDFGITVVVTMLGLRLIGPRLRHEHAPAQR